jgi:hypothetical protein
MASKSAVFAALKLLGRAFAGTVDEPKADVYHAALEELSDEELARATTIVIKTHTSDFIPPPAVLIRAVAPARLAIDSGAIVRQIEKLAVYTPGGGMVYPPTCVVARELGTGVAYAYAAAGGSRLFSENDTGRDIAVREFERALSEASHRPAAELPLLGAGAGGITDGGVLALITETAGLLPSTPLVGQR